jgi:hypothetical protein
MGLGGNSRQIFDFKVVIGKIFENQQLGDIFAAPRVHFTIVKEPGTVFGDGTYFFSALIREHYLAEGRWEYVTAITEVCDEKNVSCVFGYWRLRTACLVLFPPRREAVEFCSPARG